MKMPCPFCTITSSIPASSDPAILRSPLGSAYPVLSTSLIVAFLDIAPVSPGHVLICPRNHATKSTDLDITSSLALGFWLPVVARALMRAVGSSAEEGCWNIIQANGAEAGQTVPHLHYHIIPRLREVRDPADITDAERKNIALGEGPRVKLEVEDGTRLSGLIKAELAKEIRKLKAEGEVVVGEGGELVVKVSGNGLKL